MSAAPLAPHLRPLSAPQLQTLQHARRCYRKPGTAAVAEGMRRLCEAADPAVWAALAAGVQIDDRGTLSVSGGEIQASVKAANRMQVALHAAGQAGRLAGCGRLAIPWGRRLTDLRPLAGLPLASLRIWRADLTDLRPLAGLPLRSLDLRWCRRLRDIGPLAALAGLEELYLCGTSIDDLRPLAGLTALRTLHLRYGAYPDVRALAGLTALTALNLSNKRQDIDLAPLAGLTALHRLDLGWMRHRLDLRPLAGLAALEGLNLSGNYPPPDLAPVAGLPALQTLLLYGTDADVSPLAHRAGLRCLR